MPMETGQSPPPHLGHGVQTSKRAFGGLGWGEAVWVTPPGGLTFLCILVFIP